MNHVALVAHPCAALGIVVAVVLILLQRHTILWTSSIFRCVLCPAWLLRLFVSCEG